MFLSLILAGYSLLLNSFISLSTVIYYRNFKVCANNDVCRQANNVALGIA